MIYRWNIVWRRVFFVFGAILACAQAQDHVYVIRQVRYLSYKAPGIQNIHPKS